jgi:hypothetical protein
MSIDANSITTHMIGAVRGAVSDRWPAVRATAETELRLLAAKLEEVHQLLIDGDITEARAKELVRMQQNVAFDALRTVKGLGILTARQAVDAAARAAGEVVNSLVGFSLITSNASPRVNKKRAIRPDSPAKPALIPVQTQFKAGKDI